MSVTPGSRKQNDHRAEDPVYENCNNFTPSMEQLGKRQKERKLQSH